MIEESQQEVLVIGYFPLRGRAEVCKLLCQYLHLKYKTLDLTPEEWEVYKTTTAKNWIVKDLPFLIHKDFVVTGPHGICRYILDIGNGNHLLGNSIKDKMLIDSIASKHDLKNSIVNLMVKNRSNHKGQEPKYNLSYYWNQKIIPELKQTQKNCQQNNWYFGYLTVMDFAIYELINFLEVAFPDNLSILSKLVAVRQRLRCIQEIKSYDKSNRVPKEYCPVKFFQEYRKQIVAREETQRSALISQN